MNVNNGQALYKKAKGLIPGGTGLLSKRPEMYLPNRWPAYYSSAKGALVSDLDGNEYLDFTTNGVGACILGYANDEVNSAVFEAYSRGNMTTLNPPEEVFLAEKLIELHPWADMVRFGRTGGETCAMAARIARAATGKAKIAVCGYHGWHDWYLGVNLSNVSGLDELLLPGLEPNGVPSNLAETVATFEYNNIESLKRVFYNAQNDIAAVFMETARNTYPNGEFLQQVKNLCAANNAVLIFDEITSGFRECPMALHMQYSTNPDMTIFGKTISNGTPMAAIIGTRAVMEHAQGTFISSAYFTERSGPVAAMKTIELHQEKEVGKIIKEYGEQIQFGWRRLFKENNLDGSVAGIPSLSNFKFNTYNAEKLTFLIKDMLSQGFLITNQVYPTLGHDEAIIDRYLTAFDSSLRKLSKLTELEQIIEAIDGPIKHSTFARLL